MLKKALKLIVTAAVAIQLYLLVGMGLRYYLATDIESSLFYIAAALVGSLVAGYVIAHFLLLGIEKLSGVLRSSFDTLTAQEILSGLLGMLIGLVIAVLLGNSIYKLPVVGPYFYVLVAFFFAYMGWIIGARRRDDFVNVFPALLKSRGIRWKAPDPGEETLEKLVDTSVIIDGRVYDVAMSGFLDGTLVVPNFVLEELHKIADSSDSLKRNRGRNGLDTLGKMQKEPTIRVRIEKEDYPDLQEVDAKLVRMGQEKRVPVLTNDFNLNKVAQLQGVRVLNINELSNALKPIVLPGEQFEIKIMKEGKEASQGIGYLDDGTMVVVENGKKLVGESRVVEVTSVLQTAAGRMIFARPR